MDGTGTFRVLNSSVRHHDRCFVSVVRRTLDSTANNLALELDVADAFFPKIVLSALPTHVVELAFDLRIEKHQSGTIAEIDSLDTVCWLRRMNIANDSAGTACSVPVVIEFAPGSRLQNSEDSDALAAEAIVILKNGLRISVPADQIVASGSPGGVMLGLGGMSFEGMQDGKFVFWRVRDLLPEDRLSPDRGDKMTLDPAAISRIQVQGTQVYPRPA
jgi:hypothetical protein